MGRSIYDSRTLWEMLMLEGFQAGLAWIVILRKREAFRKAFKNFDPPRSPLHRADIARLLQDPGIVRSRAKIEATIQGARIYLAMQAPAKTFQHGLDLASSKSLPGGKPTNNTGHIPRKRPSPRKSPKPSRSAASNSLARSSSTPDAGRRHGQRPRPDCFRAAPRAFA